MSYGPIPLQGDSESLQTDVMRFMAIIAFCLIAILALVKEAAPTERPPTPLSITSPAETVSASSTAAASAAEPASPVDSLQVSPVPTPQIETREVSSAPMSPALSPRWEQPLPRPTPEPVTPRPTLKPDAKARQQPTSPSRQETAILPAPPAAAAGATADPGLSLRFASDNDFLRLIAKGAISVYAYHGPQTGGLPGREILKLDGSYQFRDSPAPGRVYELLPQTIPGLVINALRTTGRNVDVFTWAIVLPPRIEQQLERHMTRVRSGELVIDRFGEVQHVASG
ncbi:MAG: hypothetical protein R3E82_19150 [Pseudomonadales bacterium]